MDSWEVPFLIVDYIWKKGGGKMIINIANVPTFPNLVNCVIEIARIYGFDYQADECWKLALSKLGGLGFKSEPLLIFKKFWHNKIILYTEVP